jgi:hypothetical protein
MCNDCAHHTRRASKPVRHSVRPTRGRNQKIGVVGFGLARKEVAHNGLRSFNDYKILE